PAQLILCAGISAFRRSRQPFQAVIALAHSVIIVVVECQRGSCVTSLCSLGECVYLGGGKPQRVIQIVYPVRTTPAANDIGHSQQTKCGCDWPHRVKLPMGNSRITRHGRPTASSSISIAVSNTTCSGNSRSIASKSLPGARGFRG